MLASGTGSTPVQWFMSIESLRVGHYGSCFRAGIAV